jgi:hypothetical protein
MTRIKLPHKLDLEHVLQFAHEIDAFREEKHITVEMGPERYFPPYSMLFLAAKFLELKEKHPDLIIEVSNPEKHPYPAHMGFFNFMGVPYGKDIGEARGNARYLPIRALNREDLRKHDKYAELGDLIQGHADQIAEMISRDAEHKTDLYNALSYSLREIIRMACTRFG